jgi:hypothetical protein
MAADRWIDAARRISPSLPGTLGSRPPTFASTPARPVVLSFTNQDAVFHDWEVAGLANVDAGARPGQTQGSGFRIDDAGLVRDRLHGAGHAEAGMAGTLVVDPAD